MTYHWPKPGDNVKIPEIELHLPVGELFNFRLAPFAAMVSIIGLPPISKINGKERFAAQGMEGKLVFKLPTAAALRIYNAVPRFRCSLRY